MKSDASKRCKVFGALLYSRAFVERRSGYVVKNAQKKRDYERGFFMKKTILIVTALCMAFLMAACSTTPVEPSETAESSAPAATESTSSAPAETESASAPAETAQLTVAAAASLTDVTAEIAEAYKAVAPDVELVFTYASSGNLQTQIEQGAPVDIFISAAQKQMNAIEEEGLIDNGTRIDLLENKVVLIKPAASNMALTSFEDLATDTVSNGRDGRSRQRAGGTIRRGSIDFPWYFRYSGGKSELWYGCTAGFDLGRERGCRLRHRLCDGRGDNRPGDRGLRSTRRKC